MSQTRLQSRAELKLAGCQRLDDTGTEGGSVRLGSYLRTLREGYGYTLRKVEERALALGEAIDNSQLSRFEKGKAIPSFDKLRALARVFNVPVQSFSDVLDLEEYRHLKPDLRDIEALLDMGGELLARGSHGEALMFYEQALDVAQDDFESPRQSEQVAEARIKMATALRALGKLYMAEHELREVLKGGSRLADRTRMRALLQLAYLYRELGDSYLASVLARECLQLAEQQRDTLTRAGVLNSLGNMQHDEGRPELAVEAYRGALEALATVAGYHEMRAMVLTNLGGCLSALDRQREGLVLLREAHELARRGGFRRVAALSLTRMAEASMHSADHPQAAQLLDESDALAARAGDGYNDILFLNTYHRWTMAREQGNATREKIAFGRMRHLRSALQRRFPEVDAFDSHVARTRR